MPPVNTSPNRLDLRGATTLEEIERRVQALPAEQRRALAQAVDHEEQYRTFRTFAKAFWDVAEPAAKCTWSKHMDIVCDEVQEIVEEADRRREIYDRIVRECGDDDRLRDERAEAELNHLPPLRLVLLVPPRGSKSTLISRLFPPWRWLHRPRDQFVMLTAMESKIPEHGIAVRDVARSEQYRALQAHLVLSKRLSQGKGTPRGQAFTARADANAKEKMQLTSGGQWEGHVICGKYTGANADIIPIDDPHDVSDGLDETSSAASKIARMLEVESTYKTKVQDRFNHPALGIVILIMQRVHLKDLAQYMMDQGAKVVCLPAEYDPTHPHRYHKDWRTVPGEPLNPIRLGSEEMKRKRLADPHGYATKFLMRPTVQEGVLFKREWFGSDRRYHESPKAIAAECDEVVISVDCASKTGAKNDYTSMGVWGRKGARKYLLARKYGRWELPGLLREFDALCEQWPEATLKLVEDASAGSQLIQMRTTSRGAMPVDGVEVKEIPGIIPVNPRGKGDKETRAGKAIIAFQAGNVYLPANVVKMREVNGRWIVDALIPNPWFSEYEENMIGFGAGGMHDDDVDMTSQVMERFATGAAPWLGASQRETLSEVSTGDALGDTIVRWARRIPRSVSDPAPQTFMGVVPGWCTGRAGGEAVAVIVDQRGRQLSMVECREGGWDTFAEDAAMEANYWEVSASRYAEVGPVAQVVSAMGRKGVRLAARQTAGKAWKEAGREKSGFRGEKFETAALWSCFLKMLGMGLVGVRDGVTLTRLESVVEVGGVARFASGEPLSGRVLALLLAVESAAMAVETGMRKEGERRKIVQVGDGAGVRDIWGVHR